MNKVNNILNGPWKKVIYAAGALIAGFFTILIILKILFYFKYNDRDLNQVITAHFKQAHAKAVKFEEASIDSFGDIIIRDFIVSNSSDFNDNINLIQCRKAIIRISFLSHFVGKTIVTVADFYDADVTLVKRSGRTYEEFLREIFDAASVVKQEWASRGLSLGIHNARVHYRDFMREGRLDAELSAVSLEVEIDRARATWAMKGELYDYRATAGRRSWFSFKGWSDFDPKGGSSMRLRLDGVDAAYGNEFIREYSATPLTLRGSLSSDITLDHHKGARTVKGSFETANLHVIDSSTNHALVANENLDLEVDATIDDDGGRVVVKRCTLSDDVVTLTVSGDMSNREKDRHCRFSIKSNKIDLEDLSRNFPIIPGYSVGGQVKIQGSLSIDQSKNSLTGTDITVDATDLFLVHKPGGVHRQVLETSALSLSMKNNDLRMKLSARSGTSDFEGAWHTSIASIDPLTTKTAISVKSKSIDARILARIITGGLDGVLARAREDAKRGYEDIFFLQKRIGKLVNTNDIRLTVAGDAITFGKKARFPGFRADLQLKAGILTLDEFALSGYGARYAADLRGTYNTDQPFLSLRGSIRDFDVESFARDAGLQGQFTGTALIEWDYELSAYRLSQVLENSKGNLKLEIAKGELKNTSLQKRITGFIHGMSGFESVALSPLNFTMISFSWTQAADRFYIRQAGITGDTVNFQSYGSYDYKNGLQVPLSLGIRTADASYTVPLSVGGPLTDPFLVYTTQKKELRKLPLLGN